MFLKKSAKKQKNPNIIFQHAMFWCFFSEKKNIPKPNIKLVKPTIFWKNASPTSSATGNLLSVTVKRMASIIPSKSLVARVRNNQMVIACLGATGAMVETRAVLCFWLDYYNKITSHMPSYMFFLSNMMLQQHFGMVFWGWYQNDDLFCWWRCGNRPRCWRAIWEMDRMVTTTTWIKALALRNAKVAKVFWGLLAAISCFFCNPRYIINSVFIIPQIDTGKREMDQRDIDPLKSVKNKHLMWKGCKICKITVIKKIWNKPKVTISVFIYTVYSLPSFRSRIVKHSELSAMRDIM